MVSTILAVIRISIEGGATSKIGKARFGKCRLTITPPEFSKVRERRIFRKKKLAGEDPLDPLAIYCAEYRNIPPVSTALKFTEISHFNEGSMRAPNGKTNVR
jgi:hypothetical protein